MPILNDTPISDSDRKAIHDFALSARGLLTAEARDLLEGVYGLTTDGKLAPLNRLPNLENDIERQETYRRLERLLADEVKGGLEPVEVVGKLMKEIAFTHLNRLVAFKMMEVRKLIRQAVGRGIDSNGFKFYLVDHPEIEALWRSSHNGVGLAYQQFLLWQAHEIAREVRVLFDPDNLASRLFPRHATLMAVLDLLNNEGLSAAWNSTETIGWVYQFFNEKEKADVFDRLFNKKLKVRREDIPAATQLFTPRWIVRFLVENTLGRLWIDLHPDSRLREQLLYLVSSVDNYSQPKQVKLAKEITLLDPACGTMHFGLVAFDLFVEMYREELERAGESGWLKEPSVETEAEIPAAIIAHNIFGIDIDLRAVQLSALTLYLKAKEYNKDAVITDNNLACADVLALNGHRLKTFLNEMNFQRPAYERLIRSLWERLQDANQLGSLLRLETEIEEIIAEERHRFEVEGLQPDLFGERHRFESEAANADYWDVVAEQLVQAFDEFAHRMARTSDETFFTGEAVKGMRLLNLMLGRYDCVVANPPYIGRRNMNSVLADLIADYYSSAKENLYTAFISRCCEFLCPGGRVGMLTLHTFMFLLSYKDLRSELNEKIVIENVCHLGKRTMMDLSNPNAQGFAMFVFRLEENVKIRSSSIGTYFRLTAYDDKKTALEKALREGVDVYHAAAPDFSAIKGSPWVYWASETIRKLFRELPSLSEVASARQGLHTGDNPRFLRFWWEVGLSRIDFEATASETQNQTSRWFPYMKGGAYRKWYGNQEYVLNWERQGREIRNLYRGDRLASRPQNIQYYFTEGVTYTAQTVSDLNVRFLPKGFVFDFSGSCVFPTEISILELLAILNSSFTSFILRMLNPTVSFEVGDLSRVPITRSKSESIEVLVGNALTVRRYETKALETSFEFIAPLPFYGGDRVLDVITTRLASIEEQLNAEVYELYGIDSEERTAIHAELREKPEVSDEDDNSIVAQVEEDAGYSNSSEMRDRELAVRWLSYAAGIILGRFRPGEIGKLGSSIYCYEDISIEALANPSEEQFNELVGHPASFAYIDENNGRHVYSKEVEAALLALSDTDGIAVLDEGHPDDLPAKIELALELMLGERGAADIVYCIANGKRPEPSQHIELDREVLRKFLERDFFTKWHIKWYCQRPVYWLLQSPQKRYGLYIFHERITKDTLYLVQRDYVDMKINLTLQQLHDAHNSANTQLEARSRRHIERQIDNLQKLLTDLQEFSLRLKSITNIGYDPEINDGVIINMAPLTEVLPAWKKEPQKVWEKLKNAEYDWSLMAMKYWQKRVIESCKTNKSLAIAHGLEQ